MQPITPTNPETNTTARVLVRIPTLWLELPGAALDQLGFVDATEAAAATTPRQPWYDPAAMLEECERWDGLS